MRVPPNHVHWVHNTGRLAPPVVSNASTLAAQSCSRNDSRQWAFSGSTYRRRCQAVSPPGSQLQELHIRLRPASSSVGKASQNGGRRSATEAVVAVHLVIADGLPRRHSYAWHTYRDAARGGTESNWCGRR